MLSHPTQELLPPHTKQWSKRVSIFRRIYIPSLVFIQTLTIGAAEATEITPFGVHHWSTWCTIQLIHPIGTYQNTTEWNHWAYEKKKKEGSNIIVNLLCIANDWVHIVGGIKTCSNGSYCVKVLGNLRIAIDVYLWFGMAISESGIFKCTMREFITFPYMMTPIHQRMTTQRTPRYCGGCTCTSRIFLWFRQRLWRLPRLLQHMIK